jgi:gamma-glutamyltranspeptidase/glutathione hydrolase
MTTSIEGAFGSRLFVRGFLLNNQLTDFSFVPAIDGQPVANRVEGGKRPRSSMAPMIVLDDKRQLKAVVGSPGGSNIISYVAWTIVGLLDWNMSPQDAVALPHVVNANGPTTLEQGTPAESLKAALEARGHEVRVGGLNSGLNAILVGANGRLLGGADPRREGVVLGE